MSLVTLKELTDSAKRSKTAVGAFSVGNMEMILGAVKASEEMNTPIILQIAEVRLPYSPLEIIGPMMIAAAKNSKTDICVHLDHGLNEETVVKALELGFTSVMLDASSFTLDENIEKTKRIVREASKYGASVEAELGVVGGNEGDGKALNVNCTDPDEALRFIESTSVDALAVAIGNAHGDYKALPDLRYDILSEISTRCDTPLVLHGGSGITAQMFRECIRNGVRKINIATASFNAYGDSVKEHIFSTENANYFSISKTAADAVYGNVRNHIEIFNMK